MFNGETAWFSSSVTEEEVQIWEDNGGSTVTQENAMFLFSRDASNPDTTEIHQSDAYINEHISVIHPLYITDCVKAGGRDEVVLMLYNFPPTDVLKALGKKAQYKWQMEENLGHGVSSKENTGSQESNRNSKDHSPEKPKQSSNQETEYLEIDELPKKTGELQCLTPGQNGFQVHAVSGKA